jgi:hypothetical protein
MMLIKEAIASGFVVLLGGHGDSNKTRKNCDYGLAFMALTQGNVLDACFGVVNPSRREDTPATCSANEAKALIDGCATSDSFPVAAVEAYCDAFQVVINHREHMDRLNCITRCFEEKKIRKKMDQSLRESFLGAWPKLSVSHDRLLELYGRHISLSIRFLISSPTARVPLQKQKNV